MFGRKDCDAGSRNARKYRQHAADRQPREAEQQQGARKKCQQAEENDEPPVVAVGRMPGEQRQAEERQELRQSDEPQIEHPAGDVIHLPTHRDDDHLRRQGGEQPAAQIEGEIALFENREAARNQGRTQEPRVSGTLKGRGR